MAGMFDIMSGAQSGSSGWARMGQSLGEAMSGAPQRAYDDTMLRGHKVQRALMEAKRSTEQYNAMARLEDTLRDALPQEQHNTVPYISSAQIAGYNPTQGFQAARESVRNRALSEAMTADSVESLNRGVSIAAQRPLDQTSITGNTMYNPNLRPEEQQARVTPYGAGQLTNQTERTRGLNAASMASATRPRSARARSGDDVDEYEQDLDKQAEDIYRSARASGADMYQLTKADVRWQLENNGEVRDAGGVVIGTLRPGGTGGAQPSAAMTGGSVTEPQGAARTPVSGVSDEGSQLPPQARAQLKEGVHTTFANGQVWTLSQGVPVQVF